MNPMMTRSLNAKIGRGMMQYHPESGSGWKTIGTLPKPRAHFAAVYHGGAIYVTGEFKEKEAKWGLAPFLGGEWCARVPASLSGTPLREDQENNPR